MRYLLFFCFACVLSFPAAAQSNALGKQVYGGSYQAPVIYKTYKVFDEGYKAPARSSYDNSKPIYTGAPPKYGSGKSNSSASGPDASYEPLMPGSPFQDVSGKYGYKNAKGKILVAATYDELESLHGNANFDGFVRVKEKGKYGVLWAYDTEQTIPAIYDELIPLNYSTIYAKLGGKVGVIKIQTSGKSKVTVPLIYEQLGALDDYALWTKSAGKYGLVGADGRKILDQEYDEINVFSPQTVAVQQNGKTGLMNYKGKTVLPVTYESISRVSHAAAWIQKEGKWGLISQEGTILAPPQFDSIYQSNGGIIWVNDLAVIRKEGQLHYLNTKGELLAYSASTADAAARFVKNNLFEDFSIVPGRYAWKTSNAGKIAAGAYILRPTVYNIDYEKAPFPREFSYEAADDWEMEIALSKIGGGQTTEWGFMWGKNTENHTMLGFYGAYLPGSGMGHLDFNVKGGTNTIKFTRIGNVCSFYYNGSLKGTGALLTKEAGSFWLSMTHSSSGLPCTVYFDSIKFTILDKK